MRLGVPLLSQLILLACDGLHIILRKTTFLLHINYIFLQ